MAPKTFNILFFIRKPKGTTSSPYPIYMRITADTRDIFLFYCYTGLACIDIKQLREKNIQIGKSQIM